MNISMLKRARKNFVHDLAPVSVQRHNMRAWVASIRMLGTRWVLWNRDFHGSTK